MTTTQSPELTHFYQAIQKWIDDGCPEHDLFKRHTLLCLSLLYWCQKLDIEDGDLYYEIQKQFETAGLNKILPFNQQSSWTQECRESRAYQNPKRLAWIKEHANVSVS